MEELQIAIYELFGNLVGIIDTTNDLKAKFEDVAELEEIDKLAHISHETLTNVANILSNSTIIIR